MVAAGWCGAGQPAARPCCAATQPATLPACLPACLQGLLLLAPAVDISQHWQQVVQPAGVDAAGHELVRLPSAYVEASKQLLPDAPLLAAASCMGFPAPLPLPMPHCCCILRSYCLSLLRRTVL